MLAKFKPPVPLFIASKMAPFLFSTLPVRLSAPFPELFRVIFPELSTEVEEILRFSFVFSTDNWEFAAVVTAPEIATPFEEVIRAVPELLNEPAIFTPLSPLLLILSVPLFVMVLPAE